MIPGIGRYIAFVIENSVRIDHILQVDAAIRGISAPASLDQTERKSTAGSRANVSTRRDRTYAIRQDVIAGHVASRSYGYIARLRTERACPAVELGIVVIVLKRKIADDIAASVDRHIAAGGRADA